MENNVNNNIQFAIYKIDTMQFAILSEELNEASLTIKSGVAFGVDEHNRIVRVAFKYEFQSMEITALILEVAMEFQVSEECFTKQIQSAQSYILPKAFATHLAMIVVSTARGILHEKTKGKVLNSFPLALIDLTESITEDVILDREQ
jgi:hypothetical protein